MTEAKRFNIRVYGIVIKDGYLLVTDEFRLGRYMTKFPGGALELGEGTIDCIHREFKEELDQEVEAAEHFYTTDFYQVSYLLDPPQQIISIYYIVKIKPPLHFKTTTTKFDFDAIEGGQSFRWLPLEKLSPRVLTLPIDKVVAKKLIKQFKQS